MSLTTIPLSSSLGGAPVYLDSTAIPGKLIHENPSDSGVNHVITEILVVNPGSNTRTLWGSIQGPGVPVPTAWDPNQMTRIDVPATSEGNEPRIFYTPFILAPGYSYYISTDNATSPGQLYLYGLAEISAIGGGVTGASLDGYGGLLTRNAQALPDLAINAWDTIPFTEGAVVDPLNFVQDSASNRFSISKAGIWQVQTYGTFRQDKEASDRIIYTRLWDETAGIPLPETADPYAIFTDNNANAGQWSWLTPIDIPEDLVGHLVHLELGGCTTEAYTGLTLYKAGISGFKLADL